MSEPKPPPPQEPYSRFVENGDGPLDVDTTNATGPAWDIVGWLKERKKKRDESAK